MKTTFLLLFLFLYFGENSQNDLYKNNIYFEFGGHAYAYSLNYERTVFNSEIVNLNFGIGASLYWHNNFGELGLFNKYNPKWLVIPISFRTIFLPTKRFSPYVKASFSPFFITNKNSAVCPGRGFPEGTCNQKASYYTGGLGLQYKVNSRLYLNSTFYYGTESTDTKHWYPWMGLSIGYDF